MDGFLGLLFILALIVVPVLLVIGGGSAIVYLFTGLTPTEYSARKVQRQREAHIQRGVMDARLNQRAARRLIEDGEI